jgi:hypothetical protein
VFGDARRAVIVGGLLVFVVGVFVGFLLGRAGTREGAVAASSSPVPSTSGVATPSVAAPGAAGSPAVVTPAPGQEPAITNQGQVLIEGERPVVPAPATTPCQGLVSAGTLGECGEVLVAGGRVLWVVERSTITTGATALRARVFTHVPDAGGWVEWLQAADPAGERWTDVNVLAADLTGDGVSELLVGFRGIGDGQALEYDIVGYGQDGLPVVLAHPETPARGAVVVSAGQVQEYGAQYPNGEPACCPSAYLLRMIAYDAGFFRVVSSETVAPNVVPTSML